MIRRDKIEKKENTQYKCTLCNEVNFRRDLGEEARWGIFKCPSCDVTDCGVVECCEKVFEEVS